MRNNFVDESKDISAAVTSLHGENDDNLNFKHKNETNSCKLSSKQKNTFSALSALTPSVSRFRIF